MPLVPDDELEAVIASMPAGFTVLDFADRFAAEYPARWDELTERYGLYGSGTRYWALTYLGNRLSGCSRRKEPGLLEPTPRGWKPEESRFLRRATRSERERFGSPWMVVYRRRRRRALCPHTGVGRRKTPDGLLPFGTGEAARPTPPRSPEPPANASIPPSR